MSIQNWKSNGRKHEDKLKGNNTMKTTNRIALVCLVTLTLCCFMSQVSAQISDGGTPRSFLESVNADIEKILMPEVDRQALLAEDESQGEGPLRFGHGFDVNYGLKNSGTWETLRDGSRLWRLEIECPDAYSINLIFKDYNLPGGAKLFVYDDAKQKVYGAFTSRNNKAHGKFSTTPVSGSVITVEYFEPASVAGQGSFSISKIIHGYRNLFGPNTENFGESGACNVNVACPEADQYEHEIKSVAMILVDENSRICSGALVNNVLYDFTPYFLTAFHCADNNGNGSLSQSEIDDAESWIFMFGYESPSCDPSIDGPTNFTLNGAAVLAAHVDSDFLLLVLDDDPPVEYDVAFAGWSAVDIPASSSAAIHHPSGDVKKFSWDNDATISDTYFSVPNSHWRIDQWDGGTTEDGSSGSPLFDQNNRIIGQLDGGDATCDDPINDYYGKFAMSWDNGGNADTQLKDWLDPFDSGILKVDTWCSCWLEPEPIDIVYSLDRSGSMLGAKAEAMKLVAEGTLEQMRINDRVGLTHYSSDHNNEYNEAATIAYPPGGGTALIDDDVIEDAIDELQPIVIGGLTSIGAGLQLAFEQLDLQDNNDYIILLSDGKENIWDIDPWDVIDDISSTGTVVHGIFLFESSDRWSDLNITYDAAEETGGLYFAVNADSYLESVSNDEVLPSLVPAYQTALNQISSRQTMTMEELIAPNESMFVGDFPIHIHDTEQEVYFTVFWENTVGWLDVTLEDPEGDIIDENIAAENPLVEFVDGRTIQHYVVRVPKKGEWTVQWTGFNLPNERFYVSASAPAELTSELALLNPSLDEPLTIRLTLKNDEEPVVRSTVTASISTPADTTLELVLFDDGNHNDGAPDDGVYANQTPSMPGTFTVATTAAGIEGTEHRDYQRYDLRSTFYYDTDIRCGDVRFFGAKCRPNGDLLAKVTFFPGTGHNGETATFLVNGVEYPREIAGNKALLTVPAIGAGEHTVEYISPANCTAPMVVTCTVSEPVLDSSLDLENTPKSNALLPNYPEPFNPSTTIRYALARSQHVTLKVYNMLGQEVRTLVDGNMDAAYHQVTWDGKDRSGNSVASGIYIYRISAGEFTQARKMMLMK